jgi:hypothetical protein
MKIEILSVAIQDIDAGQQFYEQQQEGLGTYFQDALFSDIDALLLYAGFHQQFFGYYRARSKRFPCKWLVNPVVIYPADCQQQKGCDEYGEINHVGNI